ncbi:msl0430 [Mesorhizobium japonicum MAFF 303099]|uniref:Msl0430 protein n=2 Tax=Mesorhizobium japonicum TaxID=2066070 RepID=Q98MU9_RHILO|nr:msl0430 [Mesorhizobium japonicum MAFF 303099]
MEFATMARSKPSQQLSQAEIERFLVAAEALHWSIVKPFISPHCEHYRATRVLHEVLLKSVRDVTGKEVEFIRWFGGGSA